LDRAIVVFLRDVCRNFRPSLKAAAQQIFDVIAVCDTLSCSAAAAAAAADEEAGVEYARLIEELCETWRGSGSFLRHIDRITIKSAIDS
jgi:hypothetical protein